MRRTSQEHPPPRGAPVEQLHRLHRDRITSGQRSSPSGPRSVTSASTVRTSRPSARSASAARNTGSRSTAVTASRRRRARARCARCRHPRSSTGSTAPPGQRQPQPRGRRDSGRTPDRASDHGRSSSRGPLRAHARTSSRPRCASSAPQLEHRGVGRQRVQRARAVGRRPSSRADARSGSTRIRAGSTPAYFRRVARSAARVPGAGDARNLTGEQFEVRVPDPRNVATVGDRCR